jgi:beta-glucanase (GH16 family)
MDPLLRRSRLGACIVAGAGWLGCGAADSGDTRPWDASNEPLADASTGSDGESVDAPGLDRSGEPAAADAPSEADAGMGTPADAADVEARGEGGAEGGTGGPEQCAHRMPVAATWKLAWSDEFDTDGPPNPANWGFEQGFVRNQELQWYQPDNASVAGGILTIAAQRQQVANPNYSPGSSDWKLNRQAADYTSSSLTTSGKQSFLYGRFETCAQIDTRQGSWPAFWILGDGQPWPQSGEVDIMEYYEDGVRANVCKPSGGNCNWSGSVRQSLSSLGGSTWSSAFHLWAMEWDSQNIKLYLDDKLVYPFSVASASSGGTNPYVGNPFYILINLAVGANGGDPTSTTFPIHYRVDYVRVYQQ